MALPETPGLPDPLRNMKGDLVETVPEWRLHRDHLIRMILHYQYGTMPPAPDQVRAEEQSRRSRTPDPGEERRYTLFFGPGQSLEMRLGLMVPNGAGPFPVILKEDVSLGNVPIANQLLARGYAVAEFIRTDLDPDQADVVGPAQAAYPDYDWATLAVWAWGAMRAVDFLTSLPEIDDSKIVLTGHSRGGKVALLAGALDERIALTVPNGSGAGGAGLYRFQNRKAESLELITRPERFAYWFHRRLRDFHGREQALPFDQHFLRALVAPRAVLSTDSVDDLWANPRGTQWAYQAAQPVFDLFGVPDHNAVFFRKGQHDQTVEDWKALLAFAEHYFFDRILEDSPSFHERPFPGIETVE